VTGPESARSDKRLIWYAGICGLLLVAAIALTAPPAQQSAQAPSIYSPGLGGARAAYLLLRDLRYDVHVWEEPPAAISALAPGAVLILAEPSEKPTAGERKSLREFVDKGGRILFCGNSIPDFFPDARLSASVTDPRLTRYAAVLPSAVSRDASPVILKPRAYWGPLTPAQVRLYGDENSATVVSWRLGAGEVLWWAAATPLTNEEITHSGNLNLFLNSVSADSPSGEATPVYWDEYFHGQRAGLLSYIDKTPVGWAAFQIFLIFLAVLFTFSRRSSPLMRPAPVSRLSPLEFVDTMGALYQHAGATSIPVQVASRHLRLELARRLALPAVTQDADLADAASIRLGLDRGLLAKALNEAPGRGNTRKLRPREALARVQTLSRFLAQLASPQPLSTKLPVSISIPPLKEQH
jgi:hypothetical protein